MRWRQSPFSKNRSVVRSDADMSTQIFVFLLVVVAAGAHLLARRLPLPPGGLQPADGDAKPQEGGHYEDSTDDSDHGWHRFSSGAGYDDNHTCDYGVNIDGTQMLDDTIDVHGNAFGCNDDWMSNSFD